MLNNLVMPDLALHNVLHRKLNHSILNQPISNYKLLKRIFFNALKNYSSNFFPFFLFLFLFPLNTYAASDDAAGQQCNAQAIHRQQQNAPNKLLPELTEYTSNNIDLNKSSGNKASSKPSLIKQYTYKIINRIPHDEKAFTQGLAFYKNKLYESTGLLGQSSVRKLDSKTGKITQENKLDKIFFGEGISINNQQLVQISWKSERIFIYDVEQLTYIDDFKFNGEGWGITSIDEQLLISDGSSTLRWLSHKNKRQKNKKLTNSIRVNENGTAVRGLNELEYANGFIYANVWPSDCIAQIDPLTGNIRSWINLAGLYSEKSRPDWTAILNGIAYKKDTNNFFVTGKYWPYIYEIEIITSKEIVSQRKVTNQFIGMDTHYSEAVSRRDANAEPTIDVFTAISE